MRPQGEGLAGGGGEGFGCGDGRSGKVYQGDRCQVGENLGEISKDVRKLF